jgi:hypothetical protein
MAPVVHVIAVVHVIHVDIVGSVPDRRPGLRAWVNHTKPEALVLKTRRTLDNYDWDVVNPKPVSAAKMSTEAIFRNAVPDVASAFVPGTMLMLPIVCALTLPNVTPIIVCRFVVSRLVKLGWTMSAVLRTPLDRFMIFVPLFRAACIMIFVSLFGAVCIMIRVLRRSRACAFVVVVTFMPVRTTVMIFLAVLCASNQCRSQK